MVEWSALLNCIRMRSLNIGTENEMPGRIKLSQACSDNLPFRAGICEEIRGEPCSCHFVPVRMPFQRGCAWVDCWRALVPTTMERARRRMNKTTVRPVGEPFDGSRKRPGRRPVQCRAGLAWNPASVLFGILSSGSFRRRPVRDGREGRRLEFCNRVGRDMNLRVLIDIGKCHERISRKPKRITITENRILPGSIVDW